MTPRERFDRLFDRVMRASEGGDVNTVAQFSPMALAAFELLESPDADARFHTGLVHLASGNLEGAAAQAKAIEQSQPNHLFGSLLAGRVAEQRGDTAALDAARRRFRVVYQTEMNAARPEYSGHQVILDKFLAAATP